ncbi:NucA/NucB deoxyribonuclease domain-containing protein [Streptomyces sp. NEAU-Y11]|uniref:NucA/NucB deoxyribonuclease domain-containing protein n=1 Tax=Streptomyces cucumeris TaxID=2962890 RepID=UPI0020C91D33|nr:hypothetical protein [Streptomyces sp. NEAU-Y11]MCP9207112.1 hypothetical protein [Streptomyces sp. NEAU-Y11]
MIATLAAAALIPVMSPAAKAEGSELTVESYALPIGAKIPTLEELQNPEVRSKLARDSKVAESPAVPQEMLGSATAGLPRATEPSAHPPATADTSEGIAAAGSLYPDPSRKMSRTECRNELDGHLFYAKSRFAMCGGIQMVQTWFERRRPVGQTAFTAWVIGTIPNPKDRSVQFDYYYSNFHDSGRNLSEGLRVDTTLKMDMLHAPRARKTQSGSPPPSRTFDRLKRENRTYMHDVAFDAGQGVGPDDLITMAYQPTVKVTFPLAWPGTPKPTDSQRITFAGMNWDAAGYLPNSDVADTKKRGGAAFAYIAELPYSMKAGAPERAVAQHLNQAHKKPGETYPKLSTKDVPGFDADHRLHRLFHDAARKKKNRADARKVCVEVWGADYATNDPAGPRECDEYPFASTYEGAAQPTTEPGARKNNWSAKALAKNDNSKAGTILGEFYDKNRMIDGRNSRGEEVDGYIVRITN